MDTGRIERIFEGFKKKKLLTGKGALSMGGNIMPYLLGLFAILVVWRFLSESQVQPPLLYVLPVLAFPVAMFFFPTKKFYKDRMELSYLWGLFKRKFDYKDLEGIHHATYYNQQKGSWVKTLELRFKDTSFSFNDHVGSMKKFECLTRLMCSGFKPIFENELHYKRMIQLFAYVISLKKSPQYQEVETQCALKYFSESKYRNYVFKYDLSNELKQYQAYEGKNLPAEMGYVNICVSIMKDRGVDYADRLDLLTHLFECAYASDGVVDEEEVELLSSIAFHFVIKDWDLLSLKYRFEVIKQEQYSAQSDSTEYTKQRERFRTIYVNRKREACNLLGVSSEATLDEVKSAYRSLVKSCHPDTLPPTATEAEREEAAIRFRAVTEAYDFLCEELAAELVSVTK